jgi:hypothetical protein
VNWIAVLLAGLAGAAALLAGLVRLPPGGRDQSGRTALLAAALMTFSAVMLGHNFARIGPETLGVKPWLYWMMSGGFALWFVAPALLLSLGRQGVGWRSRLAEAAVWITAYLVMGSVFWLLG